MENFILGLLMAAKLTAYELHILIRDNYEGICSSSVGNIQRALKKLHEKGFVALDEVKDGKVTKKYYIITPAGRKEFLGWLRKPMELTKVKNMEVGKLLLLGYLSKEEQLTHIEKVIAEHQEALDYMAAVEAAIEAVRQEHGDTHGDLREARARMFEMDEAFYQELLDSVEGDDLLAVTGEVEKFSLLTLKLAVDEIKFHFEWFTRLRDELVEEMKNE